MSIPNASIKLHTRTELNADGLGLPIRQASTDSAVRSAEWSTSRLNKLKYAVTDHVIGVFAVHVQSPV